MPGSHGVLCGLECRPDGRHQTQQEVLEAEGVVFDSAGIASESQRLRTADFRDFLEDRGILNPAPRRAWLVKGSAVDGRDLTESWRHDGYVSIRAGKLRWVEPGISRQDLKSIVEDDFSQSAYSAKAAKVDDFHNFLTRMEVGDLVTTTSQGRIFLGTITGDAEYVRSADGASRLRRTAEWQVDGVDYAKLPKDVTARFRQQYDVIEMTQQLDVLEPLLAASVPDGEGAPLADSVPPRPQLVLPDATDSLAESLNVDREWLEECIELLRDRPQLIFYGPPGTGKTYIAQALAEHLAGDNVRLVQFHPAYSYEDFFEGYRPTSAGTFELRPGSFRKTVDAAMRRRFGFVSLHPSEPPVRDVLRRWLAATGRDAGVADLLDELNSRIDDPDFRIGPSYFMRDAVHADGGLERAWRTAILPLLEEHDYGDGTDVAYRYGLDAIRDSGATRSSASTPRTTCRRP